MKTEGDISALIWKERRKVCMLSNMDSLSAEGTLCDDSKHPHTVERCGRHVG
jgi:hypothetical protein